MHNSTLVKKALERFRNPTKAAFFPTFFKTGKGQYGYGDRFIGVTVPQIRSVAKQYKDISLASIAILLRSPIHEHRLCGLLILCEKYKKSALLKSSRPMVSDRSTMAVNGSNGKERSEKLDFSTEPKKSSSSVVKFYLSHLEGVNNWDLVDASAYRILGDHLISHDRKILYTFAVSSDLWKRRIAIVATYAFIRIGEFPDTLRISALLSSDKHDLIHKAVGWMLREVGKRDVSVLEKFLRKNHKNMPRTALRYAIERFPPAKRKAYLAGEI